jgi:hypothetical protein
MVYELQSTPVLLANNMSFRLESICVGYRATRIRFNIQRPPSNGAAYDTRYSEIKPENLKKSQKEDTRKENCGVFELLMQRNGQKRDKTKSKGKKRSDFFPPPFFWQKVSGIDFPKKVFLVFLNSPC